MPSSFYAGIGSRQTPPDVLDLMRRLGAALSATKILRSGGAAGADSAFAALVPPDRRQIFLPSSFFNGQRANSVDLIDSSRLPAWNAAMATVAQYHPAPDRLNDFARALMARNAMQVLGPSMNQPASMIVAWTPGAQIAGGTGQALRMAQSYGIPVRNLADPATRRSAEDFLANL